MKPKANDVRKIDLGQFMLEPNGKIFVEPILDKDSKPTGETRSLTLGDFCYVVLLRGDPTQTSDWSEVVKTAQLATEVAKGGEIALSSEQATLLVTKLKQSRMPAFLLAMAYEVVDPVGFAQASKTG